MNLSITLEQPGKKLALFGSADRHLRLLREAFGVTVVSRDDELRVSGDVEQVGRAAKVLDVMQKKLRRQDWLSVEDVSKAIGSAVESDRERHDGEVEVFAKGHAVRAKSEGQRAYLEAVFANDLTICTGPAGTGKTYLAVAAAAAILKRGGAKRLVLARPAVEAGERLGFLPGDLQAKVNPYLRPLFDALNDMMDFEQVKRFMVNDVIEVVPLAFMRGRAQPLTSQVLTPFGFCDMGSITVGDLVIGSDGRPTRVLGVYPQGTKDVFRVTFTDGAFTRCCGEHLWTVSTPADKRRGRPPRVLQTNEMAGRLRSHHNHRYEIPVFSRPVDFPSRPVAMDAYALGLLLGDGCLTGSTTPAFATVDAELVGALAATLPGVEVRHKSGVDYILNAAGRPRGSMVNPVTRVLRELDLCGTRSHTKFVPADYLYNSVDVRLAVLQGLLDTDGGPVLQAGRTSRIHYTTTSPQLREDVRFLVQSLGGVTTVRHRPAAGRKPGRANGRAVGYRNDSFVLDIRLPTGLQPFRLARKAERYAAGGIGRPMRYVHRIESDGAEQCVCIRVAAPDALYATDEFILTHNTLNDAVIILDEAQNTTVAQMLMFLTRLGHESKMIVTGDSSQVDLPDGTPSGLADAVQKLKGIPNIAVVQLDQSDIVRHRLVQNIVNAYERAGTPIRGGRPEPRGEANRRTGDNGPPLGL